MHTMMLVLALMAPDSSNLVSPIIGGDVERVEELLDAARTSTTRN